MLRSFIERIYIIDPETIPMQILSSISVSFKLLSISLVFEEYNLFIIFFPSFIIFSIKLKLNDSLSKHRIICDNFLFLNDIKVS
jgi:hypothetical protein